ncbi:hypothetical protein O181_018078 [Austropuccinia psidii MF-1]|uniref:Uncharacterized protein n=1 Tax=Austropuccinia psidii MF-1 TaxID=1389203 RepID=A0A9Q3C8D3_9BASI|nr:hypothetical protein [Austropuccinia psidii MF-1]
MKWATDSGLLHISHIGSPLRYMRVRCLFSPTCSDRNGYRIEGCASSNLFRTLMSSAGLCENIEPLPILTNTIFRIVHSPYTIVNNSRVSSI